MTQCLRSPWDGTPTAFTLCRLPGVASLHRGPVFLPCSVDLRTFFWETRVPGQHHRWATRPKAAFVRHGLGPSAHWHIGHWERDWAPCGCPGCLLCTCSWAGALPTRRCLPGPALQSLPPTVPHPGLCCWVPTQSPLSPQWTGTIQWPTTWGRRGASCLTSSAEASVAALQTQRPKVTAQDCQT